MSKSDARTRYQHMLDNALKVRELARDLNQADLESDWVRTYALVRALEIIGEAADHVSESEQQAHPDVPWAQIVGLRNRLIHGYDAVDLGILWQIVTKDLPTLIEKLEAILSQENK